MGPLRVKDLSLLQGNFHTGFGVHSATYSMGTVGFFPGEKLARA
jgi:hypothetical protein